jgi:hypothetical protein
MTDPGRLWSAEPQLLVRRETSNSTLGTAMTAFCLGLISVLSGLMLAFGSRSE